MQNERPIALSIAGLDPSAGAGLLADIKTFEQHKVVGFGACSALTCQNDSEFLSIDWLDAEGVIRQLEPLFNKFAISTVKVGLVKDLENLNEVIVYIKKASLKVKIVWDPVLKASAGFSFHEHWDRNLFKDILHKIFLITPNYNELQNLNKVLGDDLVKFASVLLKGGHNPELLGIDVLYEDHLPQEIPSGVKGIHQKHGSGCVLSSAITARLAKGFSLLESCRLAKTYTETFLNSNPTLLGYHNL
ncbi:hydroxymethylpyrimidine/phosphomethylpyrimidine kinase [Desertivirga arenae]|uniref:hydroxymethylpyrimidine/phosphomethylpyrimidine kinase n=1 Tax=Desertivirga arenae TaxID=2810309 RepID=UPI001A96290B|nr:hydroxymethylpyrimidine/phosphomethylpyrimidine kinase [Pedobacter sp. SYSU D00823]